MGVGLVLLACALPADAVPMRLDIVHEPSEWRLEPFGLPAPPGPAWVTVLFETTDNLDAAPGRHRYRGDDIEVSFFFGIAALDTVSNFDHAYGFSAPFAPAIGFDEADIAGTFFILDFEALGSARELNPAGSGSCPVHEFTTLPGGGGSIIIGRNGGTFRPSDGAFDCRRFEYRAVSATLEPRGVAEPGSIMLCGLGVIALVACRRRREPLLLRREGTT